MSEQKPTQNDGAAAQGTSETAGAEESQQPRTEVTLRYGAASQVLAEGGKTTVSLSGAAERSPIRAAGRVKGVLSVREALLALYDVVSSDFRYVPKDRTAYMAYMRLRKQASGMNVWEAQRAYVEWLQRNDPLAYMILDPIITVHPDELMFEVFSKDEGTYAKLGIDWSAVELEGERVFGTTNIDYTQALYDGVQRMRSYRETRLSIGTDSVEVGTAGSAPVIEKKIQLPDTWLRGFLQVQSAGTLPRTVFSLAPIDLYNVLRFLRMHADPKKGGRGVRIELVPGEPVRLVLEPWEEVLTASGEPYKGRTPQVVRIWGRRRLMLLRRLLPFIERVDVHLLGSGLPSFYVIRCGAFTFTLGLSGFTSANWAQAVSFDLLLPRQAGQAPASAPESKKKGASAAKSPVEQVLAYLQKQWVGSYAEISEATGIKGPELLQALQLGCQQGRLMFDVARDVYRYRPVLEAPLDLEKLAFRNDRERKAYDLVSDKGAVRLTTENNIHGVGLELTGKVTVAGEKREYRPQLLIDDEGRVKKAECSCGFFRKHQLKEGPCEHLVALRLLQAREEARRREQRGKARSTITMETRTFSKREARGEQVYQVALDRQRLKVRWGQRGETGRMRTLVFSSVDEARAAYFAHLDELQSRGFLDATTG